MAKNTGNARIRVKWVRDRAKSAYEKQDLCYICQTSQDLELHHTHSMTLLLDRWCLEQGLKLDTDEEVLEHRDRFIAEHHDEIYNQVYTLCNPHHVKLHQIFGKAPALNTTGRQAHWIELQREKYTSGSAIKSQNSYGSWFSKFT